MRTHFLCAVAIGLGLAANVFAQPIIAPDDFPVKSPDPVPPIKSPDPVAPKIQAPPDASYLSACAREPRLWFTGDYLLWWTKGAPLPQPLISVGSSGDPTPGALGQPNTRVIYGQGTADFGAFSGVRLGLGGWFDANRQWGAEASGFATGRNASRGAFSSDGTNDRALGQPFINPTTGEEAYSTSLNGVIAGSISASTSSQLYGWELNLLRNVVRGDGGDLSMLVGFRHIGLIETLGVKSTILQLQPNILSFVGVPINMGDRIFTRDSFRASTNFYGPQIGGKVSFSKNRFGVDFIGKVALGDSQEIYSLNGSTTLIPAAGGGNTTVPGGILVQSTNSGRYFRDCFAVAPEANLNLHYDVTSWARINLGYTFLFISNVARPGLAVDRTIDPGRVPSDQSFGLGTTTNSPGFIFRDAAYWAQGINLGLSVRY